MKKKLANLFNEFEGKKISKTSMAYIYGGATGDTFCGQDKKADDCDTSEADTIKTKPIVVT